MLAELYGDRLMAAMDNLKRKLNPDAVKFGALALKPTWAMRSEYFSQRYTTHWGEMPTVEATSFMQKRNLDSSIKNELEDYASSSLRNGG